MEVHNGLVSFTEQENRAIAAHQALLEAERLEMRAHRLRTRAIAIATGNDEDQARLERVRRHFTVDDGMRAV